MPKPLKHEDTIITIDHVKKKYRLYHERQDSLKDMILSFGRRATYEDLWALNDVSYEFKRGHTYGLIGENGCGKSTLLKAIANILRPESGTVTVDGRISALLELGAGFHPDLSGRENIFLNGAILRLSKAEIQDKYDDIVAFSELEEFIDMPVKSYSSGMYMRLAFAIAVNVDPDILLIDEVLAVGDISFQRRCFRRIKEYQEAGKTIIFVSHDVNSVKDLCDEAILLDHGKIVASGPPMNIVSAYFEMLSVKEAAKRQASGEDAETFFQGDDLNAAKKKRYGFGAAAIKDYAFLNSAGERVTSIKSGDSIKVRYIVEFNDIIPNPVVGMTIHSSTGLDIYGTNSYFSDTVIAPEKAGDVIEATFSFDAWLQEGNYSISLGIVDMTDGKVTPADRWVDAVTFDVIKGNEMVGITDLRASLAVSDSV
jgi:ABC-type polysaccharide/polyol phosphate transport system ATPase subunit